MTIKELLRTLAPETEIRIRVFDVVEITGRTGSCETLNIMKKLRRKDCEYAWVTYIQPLHYAQELYIECVPMVPWKP